MGTVSTAVEPVNDTKPGWQTSEFWLSFAAMVFGFIASSGVLDDIGNEWLGKIVGLIITILAALGYTASRTVTKTATIRKTAIVEAAKAGASGK